MKRKSNFPVSSMYHEYKKLKAEPKKATDVMTSNFNYGSLKQQSSKQVSYAALRQQAQKPTQIEQIKLQKEQQSQFSTRPPQQVISKEATVKDSKNSLPPKVDANQIFHKMQLKGHLKDVLDPDIERLKRYAKRKDIINRHKEKLIAAGKLPQKKSVEDNMKIEDNEKIMLLMNEKGELRDDKGNLIKIDSNRHGLKINKKQKQQDKYKQMIKLAQQNSIRQTMIFDQNVVVIASDNKREKQKSHAFHFLDSATYQSEI